MGAPATRPQQVISALLPVDAHAAHAMVYWCSLPLIDHLVQHVPPSAVRAAGCLRASFPEQAVAVKIMGVAIDDLEDAFQPRAPAAAGSKRKASAA